MAQDVMLLLMELTCSTLDHGRYLIIPFTWRPYQYKLHEITQWTWIMKHEMCALVYVLKGILFTECSLCLQFFVPALSSLLVNPTRRLYLGP